MLTEKSMDLVNQPLSQQSNKHVFLSYNRCEFTKKSFVSSFCSSLRRNGISVLKDISTELLQSTVEGSEISIIIFSKQYASSEKCLEELTKIMEFRRAYDQVVVTIFYGVNQSEVLNQDSSFGEAFQDLIQRISPIENEVSRWRAVLTEAGGSHPGFVVSDFQSKKEYNDILNIVKLVRHILDRKGLFAIDGLVGVRSQMQEVIKILQEHKSKDVFSIGIWGMGGIGKTTLARLIFDHIRYEFESACFLSDVRGKWLSSKLVLKQELLLMLSGDISIRTDSNESVGHKLKERPSHKKVLVVVDDVDDLEKLYDLCGSYECFGEGSRIIITTRNLHLLRTFQVDLVYSMKLLNDHESLQLLIGNAFKQESYLEGEYIQYCRRMAAYAEGLPLALKALDPLRIQQSSVEWESKLKKLSTHLSYDVDITLRLSFDSLDSIEKEIFLNIIVFYIGEDMNDVIQKLDARGYNAGIGIIALVDRSLVTIDNDNKLRVHNLFQIWGRKKLRESSKNNLGNRGHHKYEVFLSFRGDDTRTTFTSHLYLALCNAGINVFKDDVELPRGNHIKTALLEAIGNSKIVIIIFSRGYAASKWCLEELSIIMELHKSNDQVVLPVFHNVDPSEIRNQSSNFGKAFKDLIQRISPLEGQVSSWRIALAKAGSIAGIVVIDSRDESEYVKDVVDEVCKILDKKDLFVTDHPVGVDIRVQEVISVLQNQELDDVIMVGIWGMGGTGKTTLAKAIYNEIGRTFESRTFLSKIRKTWNQKEGKVRLQNQLLSEICKTTKMKINSIESGKITLRDRLCHKRSLVVLDDVDDEAQLKALVGSRDWFKSGSKIIITTRDQRLLQKMECLVYSMKHLDDRESTELFSWHAFKQERPTKDFIDLSKNIVAYSGGLPLALEVLGSYLFDREVNEWRRVLKKLKKIPNDKIQKKLKISFDGLDNLEKEIFLDISCFFVGMDKNEVTQILNGCKFFADIGIKTLVDRSLVTIEGNKINMHDLLREMGREIIREQSPKELGKRSRLWFHKDTRDVLSKHTGTKAVEGLTLKLSSSEKMHFHTKAFKKMKRLRLLCLDNVKLEGDYTYISRDQLKWLCWHGFSKPYIPGNFYQKELVAIDLKYSSLRKVWKETQLLFKKLKILNLSHSHDLVQTPDFSTLPNLETLVLKDCPKLSVVHHSVGLLHKLLLLDLEDCIGLYSLPRSIYRLKCLKTLILSGCINIDKLEEDIEQMESLTTLIAPTLKEVPFSLVRLQNILYLSVCGHQGLSHHVIPSLYLSWISPTNNPLPFIPTDIVGVPSSSLCGTLDNIYGPSTIPSTEPQEQRLLLQDGLEIFNSLSITNCMHILSDESCLGHILIRIGSNSQVFHTLSEMISQGLNITKNTNDCILPGDNIPYWLTFKDEGESVKFRVPLVNGHEHLKGMHVCCEYTTLGDLDKTECESCIICLMIINYTKATHFLYMEDKLKCLEEAEMKRIISNLESNDQVEVKAVLRNGFTLKKTAVYLIYCDSFDDEQMEPSQS